MLSRQKLRCAQMKVNKKGKLHVDKKRKEKKRIDKRNSIKGKSAKE